MASEHGLKASGNLSRLGSSSTTSKCIIVIVTIFSANADKFQFKVDDIVFIRTTNTSLLKAVVWKHPPTGFGRTERITNCVDVT